MSRKRSCKWTKLCVQVLGVDLKLDCQTLNPACTTPSYMILGKFLNSYNLLFLFYFFCRIGLPICLHYNMLHYDYCYSLKAFVAFIICISYKDWQKQEVNYILYLRDFLFNLESLSYFEIWWYQHSYMILKIIPKFMVHSPLSLYSFPW